MWKFPDSRTHNQIDHLLINRRRSSCIQKLRTYKGADADTDHYLLYTKFNLRLSVKWKMTSRKTKERYNIETLENSDIIKKYAENIRQNLERTSLERTDDVNSIWTQIKHVVTNSANHILRMEKKQLKKDWFINLCSDAINKRNELRKMVLQNPSRENIEIFEKQRRQANTILRREKRLYEKEKIKEIERNRYNARKFFNNNESIKAGFKP